MDKGYTLIELMITVAIVIIVSAISYVSINARLKVSKLESSVESLVSDLSYARSAAMLKGCPTRFIFCNDNLCTAPGDVTGAQSGPIMSGSEPAHYYTIMRMSQSLDANAICYNTSAVSNALDGYDYWDFERKPIMIPKGVALYAIYGSGAGNIGEQGDWSSISSAEADNSIWFETDGDLNVPIPDTALSSGLAYNIVFQIGMDDCHPGDNDNCLGYLVGIPLNGGTASSFRCEVDTGARTIGATNSSKCY